MGILKHNIAIADVIRYLKNANQYHLLDTVKKFLNNNPYDSDTTRHKIWIETVGINFPLLFLASHYIYKFAKSKGCTTFLFASRDCCHLYKIFQKLFPDTDSHYFNCSRIIFEDARHENNSSFKNYVKSLVGRNIDKTIFIDLHGTCRRVLSYFEKEFGRVPYCVLLSATVREYYKFQPITYKYYKKGKFINIAFDVRGSPIEMLNYDLIGTLKDYTDDGPVRDDLEYDYDRIKPYHKSFDFIIKNLDELNQKFRPHDYDRRQLADTIDDLFDIISDDKPIIGKYIDHVGNHKHY